MYVLISFFNISLFFLQNNKKVPKDIKSEFPSVLACGLRAGGKPAAAEMFETTRKISVLSWNKSTFVCYQNDKWLQNRLRFKCYKCDAVDTKATSGPASSRTRELIKVLADMQVNYNFAGWQRHTTAMQ